MNFQDYQGRAVDSLREETTLEILGLKLIEQAGKIAGLRKGELKTGGADNQALAWEIGWALWDIAAIAHLYGIDLGKVVSAPIGKTGIAYLSEVAGQIAVFSAYNRPDLPAVARKLEWAVDLLAGIAHNAGLKVEDIASQNLAEVEAIAR